MRRGAPVRRRPARREVKTHLRTDGADAAGAGESADPASSVKLRVGLPGNAFFATGDEQGVR